MRMRCLAAAAVLAVAVVAPARVQAQPAKAAEPAVELRIRSVNDLVERFEYVAGLAGQEEPAKQVRELIKQLSADGKGIEGLDPKRPFGAYAVVAGDVVSSPVVVMIPIADEERFLKMLKDRLSITPEKAEGGTQKVHLPLLPEPVHMKFANDYLYITLRPKDLDAKTLMAPKAFFARDDGSAISVLVRIDRIPADLKKLVIGQLELQAKQQLKKDEPNDSPAQKKLKALVADAGVSAAKTLLTDGKEFAIRANIDPKTDEMSVELTLTATDGSTLAKNIAGMSGKTSLPAGIVAAKNPLFAGGTKMALTPDLKKRWESLVDELIEEAVKNAGDRGAAQRVFDALAATLKAGELDLAASVGGPDAKGRHTLLAALSIKDGKEIEKLLKEFAPFIPGDVAEVSFDVAKVGKFALHKVEFKQIDENFEKVFGTKTVWLAIADDCLALAVEPDGKAIKEALTAKPAPTGLLTAELALAKALPVFNPQLKPDELKALLKDAFGGESPSGKDTVTLTVEGGKQLTARFKVKGKAVRLGASLDQFKK